MKTVLFTTLNRLAITAILFSLISGCSPDSGNSVNQKEALWQEVLTISEENRDSPLFGFVYDAVSDNQDNIYLSTPPPGIFILSIPAEVTGGPSEGRGRARASSSLSVLFILTTKTGCMPTILKGQY